jgi:sec-independent protein translocase protein TatC
VDKVKTFIARFTPYIEDIRKKLYSTSIFFIIFFIIGFFSTSHILKFIISLFEIQGVVIATTSPFQFADLSINIGLFCAFAVTCPLVFFHLLMFVKSALTKKERIVLLSIAPITIVLFFAGFIYGFLILYYALILLAGINIQIGIQNIWDIGMFLSQIILTSTLLGILFQFPVVFTFIIRSGVLDVSTLRSKRKLAILFIFIFTSLLPPTDGLSLIAMAFPLIALYEFTIIANSKFGNVKFISIK